VGIPNTREIQTFETSNPDTAGNVLNSSNYFKNNSGLAHYQRKMQKGLLKNQSLDSIYETDRRSYEEDEPDRAHAKSIISLAK